MRGTGYRVVFNRRIVYINKVNTISCRNIPTSKIGNGILRTQLPNGNVRIVKTSST